MFFLRKLADDLRMAQLEMIGILNMMIFSPIIMEVEYWPK